MVCWFGCVVLPMIKSAKVKDLEEATDRFKMKNDDSNM